MNSEMNTSKAGSPGAMANLGHVNLNTQGVQTMRHCLHELANVFTGVMIAGDLLSLHLAEGPLQHYAAEVCAGSERGCILVREIRGQLLAACGEAEVAPRGHGASSMQGA